MRTKALKAAFPYTMPVLIGYLFIGIAFGVLLSSKGGHFGWAVLMSIAIYAGSMQFVAINILTGSFDPIGAFVLTITVNARHLFYGLSMITKFRNMENMKPYMIFSLTDETYSLLCTTEPPEGVNEKWFYFFISLLDQCYWIAGSAIGAIAGQILSINTKGIDFIMTALFVVIFTEQWENTKNHYPALFGAVLTILCLILFGTGNFLIPSMLAIFVVLILFRKKFEVRSDAACSRL